MSGHYWARGWAASFLPMPILPKIENTWFHLGKIYADILNFANANVA